MVIKSTLSRVNMMVSDLLQDGDQNEKRLACEIQTSNILLSISFTEKKALPIIHASVTSFL